MRLVALLVVTVTVVACGPASQDAGSRQKQLAAQILPEANDPKSKPPFGGITASAPERRQIRKAGQKTITLGDEKITLTPNRVWPAGRVVSDTYTVAPDPPIEIDGHGEAYSFVTGEGHVFCSARHVSGAATMTCDAGKLRLVCDKSDCRTTRRQRPAPKVEDFVEPCFNHACPPRPWTGALAATAKPEIGTGIVVRLDHGLRCLAVARAIVCRRADRSRFLFSTDELTEEKDDRRRIGIYRDAV